MSCRTRRIPIAAPYVLSSRTSLPLPSSDTFVERQLEPPSETSAVTLSSSVPVMVMSPPVSRSRFSVPPELAETDFVNVELGFARTRNGAAPHAAIAAAGAIGAVRAGGAKSANPAGAAGAAGAVNTESSSEDSGAGAPRLLSSPRALLPSGARSPARSSSFTASPPYCRPALRCPGWSSRMTGRCTSAPCPPPLR